MKFWNTCVLGFFGLVVIGHVASSKEKVQLCGSKLIDVIQLVCNGNYYTPYARKRRDARHFLFNHIISRMRRELIVDECCRNTCTFKTIQSYCHTNTDNGRKDEELFAEYLKKYQPLSNSLQRGTQLDETPRATKRPSTYNSNEVVKGAPKYENFAYHDFQNLHKGKLVWGNYYD